MGGSVQGIVGAGCGNAHYSRTPERRRGDAQLGDARVDERDGWISAPRKKQEGFVALAIVTKRETLVAAALDDPAFIRSLYDTIRAWEVGFGVRCS
jgi:hypothetical protein